MNDGSKAREDHPETIRGSTTKMLKIGFTIRFRMVSKYFN